MGIDKSGLSLMPFHPLQPPVGAEPGVARTLAIIRHSQLLSMLSSDNSSSFSVSKMNSISQLLSMSSISTNVAFLPNFDKLPCPRSRPSPNTLLSSPLRYPEGLGLSKFSCLAQNKHISKAK